MEHLTKGSKFISLVVAVAFSVESIAIAQPVSSQLTLNKVEDGKKPAVDSSRKIFIPEQYGRIDEAQITDRPQVILVKDAHCVYEAQKNISKILDILIKDYKIDLICVEGASQFVNPQIVLKSNPKEEARKKISDKFLKTGLLTASEALSINKGKTPGFTIWGVEDLKLYLEDYKAFKDTINDNSTGKRFVELLNGLIDQLKNKIYSSELIKFDQIVKEYESNKLPLTKFINILNYRHDVQRQYGNIKLVIKSLKLEKQIDFTKVEKERSDLIRGLEKILPKETLQQLIKQSLLFKLGKISAVEYYKYLTSVGSKSLEVNLRRYIRLVILQDKINETDLFGELSDLTEEIYIKSCTGKVSHDLYMLGKDVNVLSKMLSLEATREDLAYYTNNKERFTSGRLLSFIRVQAPLNGISLPPELNDDLFLAEAEKAIKPAGEFYKLALERDSALVSNLINAMQKNKKDKAILVCGGFHADGINKILQDKGISTVTITPSITKIQEDSREIYIRRMLDNRIDPSKMLKELGLENLGPELATGSTGIKLGLPQPVIDALKGKYGSMPKEFVSKEEFRLITVQILESYNEAVAKEDKVLVALFKSWAKDIKEQLKGERIPELEEILKEAGTSLARKPAKGPTDGKANIPEFKKVFGVFGVTAEEALFRLVPVWLMYLYAISHPWLSVTAFFIATMFLRHYFVKWHLEKDRYAANNVSAVNLVFLTLLLVINNIHPINMTVFLIWASSLAIFWHEFRNSDFRLRFKIWKRALISFLIILSPLLKLIDIKFPEKELPPTALQIEPIEVVAEGTPTPYDLERLFYNWHLRKMQKDLNRELTEAEKQKLRESAKKEAEGYREKGIYNPSHEQIDEICNRIAGVLYPAMSPHAWPGFSKQQLIVLIKAFLKTESDFRQYILRETDGKPEVFVLLSGGSAYGITQVTDIAIQELGRIVYFSLNIISNPDMSDEKKEEARIRLREIYTLLFSQDCSEDSFNRSGEYFDLVEKRLGEMVRGERDPKTKKVINAGWKDEVFAKIRDDAYNLWEQNARMAGAVLYTIFEYINANIETPDAPIWPIVVISYNKDPYSVVKAFKAYSYLGLLQAAESSFYITRYTKSHEILTSDSAILDGIPQSVKSLAQGVAENFGSNEYNEARLIINKIFGTRPEWTLKKFAKYVEEENSRRKRENYRRTKRKQALLPLLDLSEIRELLGIGSMGEWRRRQSLTLSEVFNAGSHGPLKAPGSEGLDEDSGAKEYIEKVIKETRQRKETYGNANFHILNLGEWQLGIPRKDGAVKPQELVYAYGKNIDGELHIYVTEAFWNLLQKKENSKMLAFLADHEYEENILGKPHREVSKRAWNPEFIDKFGMNVFYKFYIDLLAEAEDIGALIEFLSVQHPNDPNGIFKNYVLEALTLKLPSKLQDEMELALNDKDISRRQEKILNLKGKLFKLHDVIKKIATENGTASCLVYEKFENILHDILRKGNTESSVNLMCITLPMAILNSKGYDMANSVKIKFYKKIEDYFKQKPHTQDDRGVRFAYDEFSGQYYGFSQARLYVIGLNEDDFENIKLMFKEVLNDSEIGIEKPEDFPIYAGHMLVTLKNSTILINFNEAKRLSREEKTEEARKVYRALSIDIRNMVVDAMREVTGRAEAAEKSRIAKSKLKKQGVLGETDNRSWLAKENNIKRAVRKDIEKGKLKTIPENEYDTGKIPRLGHETDYLNWLLALLNELETDKTKLMDVYKVYSKYLNQGVLRAFQDKRYSKSYKKNTMDILTMAMQDGALNDYVKWLKEKGMIDLADSWDMPLKMTKMGDEVWLYFATDNGIQQMFIELDKFNAFNEQYPPDSRDSIYHQILDLIFDEYKKLKEENIAAEKFAYTLAVRIRDAVRQSLIKFPSDAYDNIQYVFESKDTELLLRDAEGREKTVEIKIKYPSKKPIEKGELIPLGRLKFQYTEKAKGKRIPLYLAARKGSPNRKILIYERRIITADGKEDDITEEIVSGGWELSPYIGFLDATITIDTQSLTKLSSYRLSNLNTWQKKNNAEKVLDVPEVLIRRIIKALKDNGVNISEDAEDAIQKMNKIVLTAKEKDEAPNFNQLRELLKDKAKDLNIFKIANDISRPLSELVPDADADKMADFIANVLEGVLKEAQKPQAEEKKSPREKFFDTVREKLLELGVTEAEIAGELELAELGMFLLEDERVSGGSYLGFMKQVCELTGISKETLKTMKSEFKKAGPAVVSDSAFGNAAKRLKLYRNLNNEGINGKVVIDLDLEGELAGLDRAVDFKEVSVRDSQELVRYLSGTAAADEGTEKLIEKLDLDLKKEVCVSIHEGLFIDIDKIDGNKITYSPGITAVLKRLKNLKVEIRAKDITKVEVVLNALISEHSDFKDRISVRKEFEDLKDIPKNEINKVYVLSEKQMGQMEKLRASIRSNELKVFCTSSMVLHGVLIYGALYGSVGNMFEKVIIDGAERDVYNEDGEKVISKLEVFGVSSDEIKEMIDNNLPLIIITTKELLKQFQLYRATIEVAA